MLRPACHVPRATCCVLRAAPRVLRPACRVLREIVRRLEGKRYAETMATFQEIIKRVGPGRVLGVSLARRLQFERPRSNGVSRWPDGTQRFHNGHQIVQHLKRLARVRHGNRYSTFSRKWRRP